MHAGLQRGALTSVLLPSKMVQEEDENGLAPPWRMYGACPHPTPRRSPAKLGAWSARSGFRRPQLGQQLRRAMLCYREKEAWLLWQTFSLAVCRGSDIHHALLFIYRVFDMVLHSTNGKKQFPFPPGKAKADESVIKKRLSSWHSWLPEKLQKGRGNKEKVLLRKPKQTRSGQEELWANAREKDWAAAVDQ